jgi:Mg2+ and Co2+ transporter CorA
MTESGTRLANAGRRLDQDQAVRDDAAASICQVVHEEQVGELHLNRENAERLLATGSFFWMDLSQPTEEDFAVLDEVFHFHPLALEDS